MFKTKCKKDDKFDLFKMCSCSCKKKQNTNENNQKKGISYDAIKESITQEISPEKYRK